MKIAFRLVLIVFSGIFVLTSLTNANLNDRSKVIDKTIIREADLTRDGKPEKIVLHVTGNDIRSPFTWTIEIFSKRHRIFYKKESDTVRFDSLFSEPGALGDCNSYESCKEKWYFSDILERFLIQLDPYVSELLQSRGSGPWLSYDDIKDLILKTGKASLDKAKRITEDLKRLIESGNAIGIDLNFSIFTHGPIAIWIPVIDDFVVVFDVS